MILENWIKENTKECKSVVEFGSMFFDKLSHASCPKKIGIEIWEPYILNSKYNDCIKIQGDFTKFEEFIDKEDMDCAMFIDSLEHLDRETAFSLMKKVMNNFNKVLLMIPEGTYHLERDVTGLGADFFQTHRSTWYENDIKQLGFSNIIVDKYFHEGAGYENTGCIFAIWNKNE